MKIYFENKLKKLKEIVQQKAKYQKVMLLFDESVFNKELVLYYISLYPLSLELEELLFNPEYKEILTEYIKIHPMENVGKFCELI